MSVQRCAACGGLFAHMPRGICATCLDRREADFRSVRDWLREHRGSGIGAAAAATGVDEALIVRFIREGRIEVVNADSDPAFQRGREDEERRAELVRRLSDAPRLGTSVRDDADADPGAAPAARRGNSGMRARRS